MGHPFNIKSIFISGYSKRLLNKVIRIAQGYSIKA